MSSGLPCELCGGSGYCLAYYFHERRRNWDGSVLTLKPQRLSAEEYREKAKTLPLSPIEWRPGDPGFLSAASMRCACNPERKPAASERKPRRHRRKRVAGPVVADPQWDWLRMD